MIGVSKGSRSSCLLPSLQSTARGAVLPPPPHAHAECTRAELPAVINATWPATCDNIPPGGTCTAQCISGTVPSLSGNNSRPPTVRCFASREGWGSVQGFCQLQGQQVDLATACKSLVAVLHLPVCGHWLPTAIQGGHLDRISQKWSSSNVQPNTKSGACRQGWTYPWLVHCLPATCSLAVQRTA